MLVRFSAVAKHAYAFMPDFDSKRFDNFCVHTECVTHLSHCESQCEPLAMEPPFPTHTQNNDPPSLIDAQQLLARTCVFHICPQLVGELYLN